jgi:hypothetical protein
MNGYGIPDYEPAPEWGHSSWFQRWRCKRKGGHFGPIERFVLMGNMDVNSLVCSNPKCRAYLGDIPIRRVEKPLAPPSP